MTEGNFTLATDKGKKMTNYNSSNVVAMDMNQPDHMVSFGKKTGCYISRGTAWFLAVLFISCVVATGLLVYYYAPRVDVQEAQGSKDTHGHRTIQPTMETTTKKMHMMTTTTKPATTTTATEHTTTMSLTTTMATEAPAMEEKIDVRLPRSLKPLHYTVKLQPFVNGNFSIMGYVEIEMEVLESTSNITLHITDIVTHNDTVKLVPSEELESNELEIKMHQYDKDREFYIAHLEQPLEQGKKYVFSMHYLAYLNDKLKGFYRSSYKDADGNDRWLATTQFQATHARKAFPCFDEPGIKATFDVYLAREENMTSISNMPIAETMPMSDQDGWFWDHYNTSVPMSTYLVAFVVSDFAHMNASDNGTLFRVWARESAIDQADYSLEIGPPILEHFEEYFQVPYPLPKQDMIALPDFAAGAMENWGLITYRETAMLYDPELSSIANKHRIALVVAHELAHQWFGNIVTPKWWDDLWLNEGFASFVQYIGMDHVSPDWKVMEQFVIEKVQNVFGVDSLESSHRISIPVGHPNEIGQIFDGISYNKGASIIRMMNHFLTEASLRKGLSNYLDAFQFDNAEQDDLWHYLTKAAHEDGTLPQYMTVKEIMDTWTLQMGYPVIKVMRNDEGTSATVTQKRFLVATSEDSTDDHDYKWWVPLNYASQESPNFTDTSAMMWMKDTEAEVTIDTLPANDQWVIFNLQETGFYRVNYDDNNWNLIVQQLQEDHEVIDTINRAQVIDDAMDLARAGQLSYETALSVYSYLGNETEFVPWQAAVNNLGYITSMMKQTGGYGALKNYIKDMVIPLYETLGFANGQMDPMLEQYKRRTAIAWACKLEHQDCLDNAAALYSQWMQDPDNTTIVSPIIKFTVYCKAIEAGGEEEWNFAWKRYLQSNVASEKSLLLSALGCTKKIWILSRYLEMAFTADSGIRRQDSDAVFSAVAGNQVGRPLAWTYLRDNWKMIFNYHGQARKRVISSATRGFNTKLQLKEVEMFQQENEKDLSAATRSVQQSIESIKNNIAWMENNYEGIVQWLENNGYPSTMSNAL